MQLDAVRKNNTPGLQGETGGAVKRGDLWVDGTQADRYIFCILRTIASAIWRVPTAVGSLRSAFMS